MNLQDEQPPHAERWTVRTEQGERITFPKIEQYRDWFLTTHVPHTVNCWTKWNG